MIEQHKAQAREMEWNSEERNIGTADIAAASRRRAESEAHQRTVPSNNEDGSQPTPLLADDELTKFRACWGSIQTGFVDDPRRSVEDADTLVAGLMKRLAETFADERARLENQWSQNGNVSTEDLRVALRRYRSFFDRLLSL